MIDVGADWHQKIATAKLCVQGVFNMMDNEPQVIFQV